LKQLAAQTADSKDMVRIAHLSCDWLIIKVVNNVIYIKLYNIIFI
jgi:hypothetical protein